MSQTTHPTQPTQLGRRLQELRQQTGLSLRSVAAKTGVTDSQLHKIEAGITKRPTQDSLNGLARFYNIDPLELYSLAGYEIATGLPGFAPYLRSKYDLPSEAVDELRSHFEYLKQKYEQQQDNND